MLKSKLILLLGSVQVSSNSILGTVTLPMKSSNRFETLLLTDTCICIEWPDYCCWRPCGLVCVWNPIFTKGLFSSFTNTVADPKNKVKVSSWPWPADTVFLSHELTSMDTVHLQPQTKHLVKLGYFSIFNSFCGSYLKCRIACPNVDGRGGI